MCFVEGRDSGVGKKFPDIGKFNSVDRTRGGVVGTLADTVLHKCDSISTTLKRLRDTMLAANLYCARWRIKKKKTSTTACSLARGSWSVLSTYFGSGPSLLTSIQGEKSTCAPLSIKRLVVKYILNEHAKQTKRFATYIPHFVRTVCGEE